MSLDEMTHAIDLLERHYGRLDLEDYRSSWASCVRFILERQMSVSKFAKAWPELTESWLCDVQEVARVRREELWELLQTQGISASLVAFLHKLAKWWQDQIEQGHDPLESDFVRVEVDSDESDAIMSQSEWHREVFRQDRTLAGRVACVIFGARQFPMTRGVWRVSCRHQWTSWHDDAGDASSFFEQFLAHSPVDFAQFAEWMILVSADFCGAKPKCQTCPLQPLLGPGGPCEPEESGDFA